MQLDKPYGFWLDAIDESVKLWHDLNPEIAAVLQDLRREVVLNQRIERNQKQMQEEMESWTDG